MKRDAVKISFWICARMWVSERVCVCGFFPVFIFNFNFYFYFLGAFYQRRPNKNAIYIFSVVVSDLGSHTRMQSGFCIIFIAIVYTVRFHIVEVMSSSIFSTLKHSLSLSLYFFFFTQSRCFDSFFVHSAFFSSVARNMEWKLYILYFMYGVIFMAVVALVVLVCPCSQCFILTSGHNDG